MPEIAQLRDQAEDFRHQLRRQAERRLIHQQQLRPRHQRPRDCQHLLLTAGEVARRLVQALPQDGKELRTSDRDRPAIWLTVRDGSPRRGAGSPRPSATGKIRRPSITGAIPLAQDRFRRLPDERLAVERRSRRATGCTTPMTLSMVVLLPAPLTPISPTISPSSTSRVTCRAAPGWRRSGRGDRRLRAGSRAPTSAPR